MEKELSFQEMIIDEDGIRRAITRIAHEIVEEE